MAFEPQLSVDKFSGANTEWRLVDTMAYQKLDTVPDWVLHIPGEDADKPRWSGTFAPPEIGTEVLLVVKNDERLTVVGYFTEGNYLGLLCTPVRYEGQTWHVFGAEIALP